MIVLRAVHTAELAPRELTRVRGLLDAAFAGRFDDSDWSHALGGMHVLATEGDLLVAHAAVVQRQLVHGDRPIRTGYVEAVAVDAARRGRGHGAAVMAEAERIIRSAYELGALSAAAGVGEMYAARGWLPWQGPTAVLTTAGPTRTPEDDGSAYVLPVSAEPLDRTGLLVCDWRVGDVW